MILIDLVPLLVSFAVCAVCVSLLWAYRNTTGALLAWLAAESYSISILGYHPFHWLGDGIEAANSYVNNALAAAVKGSEWAWHEVLHANAVLWHDTTAAVADLAEATERALVHLPRAITNTIIPAWVYPLRTTVHYLQKLLARLEHTVATLPRTITHTVTHEATKVITKVEKVTRVVTKPEITVVHQAVAGTLPRVGAIEREVTGLEKWVRAHTKDATAAGIAALLIGSALAKMGMSWLRCSNVNRVGKFLCGFDRVALDALLAGLAVYLGTIGIEAFAKDVQAVTLDFEKEVRKFWRGNVTGPGHDRALGQTGL